MDFNQLNEFITNHLLLFMALLAILAMLVGGELRHRLGKVKQVMPGEATRLLNHEDAIMVDIRTDKDYRDGHIVNAVHAPADNAATKLQKYRDQSLIIYCRNGQQSVKLGEDLVKQGFGSVYNLKGGLAAWQQADLPLSKGK
ncbi:MAG: rhodanese-like domain-containing protein [Gammaproteobacteria bacterium]|jgi:rhodanese-related sulfurtransferase|nr:rhodanese-like domain-containing protein [Gammaproteobacteria bacterium]